MLIGSIAALCWALFVVYPLNVGRCRYFMESRQSLTPVSTVVSTFRRPYGNPIVVQLLTDLKSRWASCCSLCRASTGRTAMRLCLTC